MASPPPGARGAPRPPTQELSWRPWELSQDRSGTRTGAWPFFTAPEGPAAQVRLMPGAASEKLQGVKVAAWDPGRLVFTQKLC